MIWVGFIINSWVHLYFLNQFTFKFKHFIRSGHFDAVPNCYFEILLEKMSKNDVILIILIYLEHNKAMCYYLGHVNTELNHKCNLSMEKVIAIANCNRNRSVENSFKYNMVSTTEINDEKQLCIRKRVLTCSTKTCCMETLPCMSHSYLTHRLQCRFNLKYLSSSQIFYYTGSQNSLISLSVQSPCM